MQQLEHYACFDGQQSTYCHYSATLHCEMKVAVYLPPNPENKALPVLYWLSGLTCTEQNFMTKAGAQKYAAANRIILVAPDTSPRGEDVPNDDAYDLGQGAGFYLNATQAPWSKNYQMYDYIIDELRALIDQHFPTNKQQSIMGHSMGGHGALVLGLRNSGIYKSISAFSPIVAPSQVPWGQKAFTAYLGEDQALWSQYDAAELLQHSNANTPILIDQGGADSFLSEQLKPELFCQPCTEKQYPLTFNLREGYDHSYYFIASFIESHIRFHALALHKS